MGVRVKIRLKPLKRKGGGKDEEREIEGVALLNAGFESEGPEAIIPTGLAEKLGLWPRLPEGTEVGTYEVAGGDKARTYYIPDCLQTQVVTEDTTSSTVKIAAVIMEGEKEILVSDKLIHAYKIVLEDAGEGIWRFRDEDKKRKSEKPAYW